MNDLFPFNSRFELKFAFSYGEALNILITSGGGSALPPYDAQVYANLLRLCEFISVGLDNSYELPFLILNPQTGKVAGMTSISVNLLNKLYMREKDNYCFITNTDNNDELVAKSKKLFQKITNILDYTYEKYKTLIELYEDQEEHLLDRLKSIRTEAKSITSSSNASGSEDGIRLYNDTPQNADVVADLDDNQFVSELNKDHTSHSETGQVAGSEANTFNEEHDPETIIQRLKEVKDKYSQLYREWLDEFDGLFIEEANY